MGFKDVVQGYYNTMSDTPIKQRKAIQDCASERV